jgi:hypothetical protein
MYEFSHSLGHQQTLPRQKAAASVARTINVLAISGEQAVFVKRKITRENGPKYHIGSRNYGLSRSIFSAKA